MLCAGCFFFSSRRRHTRSLCDWSSDVCSSDLADVTAVVRDWVDSALSNNGLALIPTLTGTSVRFDSKENKTTSHGPQLRSEERRVGKECRCRCLSAH